MKKVKNILKCLIVCILFLFVLSKISNVVEKKTSIKKYKNFYEDNTQLDILLSGSSHMMNTILPMELYNSYGITSYNIANNTEAIPTTYWVIKNALDYKVPKIIVIDIFYDGWGSKVQENNKSFLHNFFDSLPLSYNKLMALKDLLSYKDILEYLYNFSIYHSRWNNLDKDDFVINYSKQKGAEVLTSYEYFDYDYSNSDTSTEVRPLSKEYIYKIKKLCDEYDIKLILVLNPFCAKEDEIKTANGYKKLADELGIDYIDMLHDDIIDYSSDMANRGHVNIRGAIKTTEYIGKYLTQRYDNILEKNYNEKWDDDLKNYNLYKENLLINTNNINELFTLASISNNYYLEVVADSYYPLYKYNSLINNFNNGNIRLSFSEKKDYNISITIYDKNTKELIKSLIFDNNDNLIKE